MLTLSFPNPNKKTTSPHWRASYDEAKKNGISVFEYDKRCTIVHEHLTKLTYNVGDVLYPHSASLYHKRGKARVLAICRHYKDYGDVKWDDQLPMLVAACWDDKPNEVFNCTVLYLQNEAPTGVKV